MQSTKNCTSPLVERIASHLAPDEQQALAREFEPYFQLLLEIYDRFDREGKLEPDSPHSRTHDTLRVANSERI